MSSSYNYSTPSIDDLFDQYIRTSIPVASAKPCLNIYGNRVQNNTGGALSSSSPKLDLSWLDTIFNIAELGSVPAQSSSSNPAHSGTTVVDGKVHLS